MSGGPQSDTHRGEAGNDVLFAFDGAGGDAVSGGSGVDACASDVGDAVVGCEPVAS